MTYLRVIIYHLLSYLLGKLRSELIIMAMNINIFVLLDWLVLKLILALIHANKVIKGHFP